MTLLDRYIAKQYLINTITLMVLLFSFVVTVDVALNLDRFIDTAAELPNESDSSVFRRALVTVLLIADLWWPRLLQLFNFMLGLVLVGAMGFTFAQLVRHRELVAVLAGGISLRRVARPIMIVAVGMTALQVVDQELILPRIAPLLVRDHGDAGKRDLQAFDVKFTRDSEGRIFLAQSFEPEAERISGLEVWIRKGGVATQRISASTAVWRDGGWDLSGVRVLSLTEETTDTPPPSRIETDVDPVRLLLRRFDGMSQNLSWGQLSTLRNNPRQDPRVRETLDRIRFGRISTILSNFLSLIIAMPFFLLREPKNMVIQTLKCAPVAIGAIMGGILGAAAPIPGLPAAFSVFIPVIILTTVAIAMATSIRT